MQNSEFAEGQCGAAELWGHFVQAATYPLYLLWASEDM